MTTRPGRRTVAAAALSASLLVLTACGSQSPDVPRARQASTDVPFTGCDKVEVLRHPQRCGVRDQDAGRSGTARCCCTPTATATRSPRRRTSRRWRRRPCRRPTTRPPSSCSPRATPSRARRTSPTAGRSRTASRPPRTCTPFFVDNIGQPYRTEIWGDSLGGLITQMIAEKHPEWVDGAAPLCGVMAGVVPNMNLALDVSYAVKTLIYPEMKLTGYTSYQEAVENWTNAMKALIAAASDVKGGGTAKILYIAALVDAPSQTLHYDGSSVESKVKATVEALATDLGYAHVRALRPRAALRREPVGQRRDGLPGADRRHREVAHRHRDGRRGRRPSTPSSPPGRRSPPTTPRRPRRSRRAATPRARSPSPRSRCTPRPTRWSSRRTRPSSSTATRRLRRRARRPRGSCRPTPSRRRPTRRARERRTARGTATSRPTSNVAIITLLTDWVQNGVFPGTGGHRGRDGHEQRLQRRLVARVPGRTRTPSRRRGRTGRGTSGPSPCRLRLAASGRERAARAGARTSSDA